MTASVLDNLVVQVNRAVCVIFSGRRGRRDTHFADPRPLSGYHAVAGRFDEVGRTTAALAPWRLVT